MLTDPSTACLPITKPIFRSFISGSILSSKSISTGPNALSNLTSSKGIKLRNTIRTRELDDNSSERQLAESEDGRSGDRYYDTYAERGGHTNTTITSFNKAPDRDADTSRTYGIQVKNETEVCYESAW